YGLKKKEEPPEEEADPMADGRVGRKKKTPAELAAEANKEESDDEEFAKFPPNFIIHKSGLIVQKQQCHVSEGHV
ncbi:complexin, partial [Biomphalaria glabrata]